MNATTTPLQINLKGRLTSLERPLVMGILNATPDSFYANSRCNTQQLIAQRAEEILSQGADIIDLGAYSSRPNAVDISPKEEMQRLAEALNIIVAQHPDAILSVDTFRAEVARWCVEEYGVAMVNDISGGAIDPKMFDTVAKLNVPYILMHMRGTPQTMQQQTHYDEVVAEVMQYFAQKLEQLTLAGVNDVILDPGFGFSKNLVDNYRLMQRLDEFHLFGLPILAGISRKSMIYKLLDITPQEALNGTTVLNTIALMQGAQLLRVHDVKEAVACVKIAMATLDPETIHHL